MFVMTSSTKFNEIADNRSKYCAWCTRKVQRGRQWFATGRFLSPGTLVSSTNKTDRHDTTEILVKVALNTINQTKPNQSDLLPEAMCLLINS
jgi:hypothetical protein